MGSYRFFTLINMYQQAFIEWKIKVRTLFTKVNDFIRVHENMCETSYFTFQTIRNN